MIYLLLAGILVFLVFLIIFLAYSLKPTPKPLTNEQIQKYLDELEKRGGFTEGKPYGDRGFCFIYVFSGPVTQNTEVVDSLEPVSPDRIVQCIDSDSAVLRKVSSKCQREDYCIFSDGSRIPAGETFVYYEFCETNKEPCYNYDQSYLGYLSLNYNIIQDKPGVCLTLNNSVTTQTCQAANPEQLIRISRALPISLTGNSSGPLVKLFDRNTGFCVVPESIPPVNGTPLILSVCAPNSGYTYWIIPPIQFSEGNNNFLSPEQLVFTPQTSFFPENLADYFSTNTAYSVQISNNRLVLRPFVRNSETPEGQLAQTRLIPFTSYN